jgi:predicted small secreted protein
MMIKKVLLVLALTGILFGAFGCNTVEGIGRDISALGTALADTAHDAAN